VYSGEFTVFKKLKFMEKINDKSVQEKKELELEKASHPKENKPVIKEVELYKIGKGAIIGIEATFNEQAGIIKVVCT